MSELERAKEKLISFIKAVEHREANNEPEISIEAVRKQALFWSEMVKALSLAELAKNNDGWSN